MICREVFLLKVSIKELYL